MVVVIFRARVRAFDDEYARTAARLRELALAEFGCIAFHAVTEGDHEIALSYWPDEEAVRAWRSHPEHVVAQQRGRDTWYRELNVDVATVTRSYQRGGA